MKHTLIILLLGITLGISSTALVNYLSNHDRDISHYTIQDNNTQIINDLRSKLQPDKYQKFEQIHTILQKEYYHTSGNIIDEKAMIESALHGFVHWVWDPYTVYFDTEESDWLNQVLAWEQKFEWIGAVVGRRSEWVQVMEVLKWSPAQQAGIKPLDVILEVNGETISNNTVSETVKLIRWPKWTSVNLTLFRESEQRVITVDVLRDSIDVPSVSWNVINTWDSSLWYISLSIFWEDTYQKFYEALQALNDENIQWYIIDLRWNGGGFLPIAVDIASLFIPKWEIITTTRYSLFPAEIYRSDGRQWANNNIPITILVDEYSASASEVVALALKTHRSALIIWEKTFGKWSIQTLHEFNDGSSLKYTIGRWYDPTWNTIDRTGITPDYEIIFDIKAYQSSGFDNQLNYAINNLTE